MKERLFILLSWIFLIQASGLAQAPLTYGQTYDFEVGDILQTKSFQGLNAPIIYVTSTILTKLYSINLDTISYTRKRDIYTYYSKDSTKFKSMTDTLVITNLNDTVLRSNGSSSCYALRDSFFSSYCNAEVWFIKPIADTACWNQHYEDSWFIKNLGGPYYNSYQEQGDVWYYDLIYYKNTSGTCGNFISAVNEYVLDELDFSIFPNPTNDIVNVALQFPLFGNIEIVNSFGQTVYTMYSHGQEKFIINLPPSLPNGLYFFKLTVNGSVQMKRFLLN